jgi:hypothetical protein
MSREATPMPLSVSWNFPPGCGSVRIDIMKDVLCLAFGRGWEKTTQVQFSGISIIFLAIFLLARKLFIGFSQTTIERFAKQTAAGDQRWFGNDNAGE